jgi:hypothetical protein
VFAIAQRHGHAAYAAKSRQVWDTGSGARRSAFSASSWGQVLGTGAGLLKGTRGRSRHTSTRAAKRHRSTENEAGSATPPTRR